jgi:hypothetical protein
LALSSLQLHKATKETADSVTAALDLFSYHFGKAGLKNLSQKLSGITETEESNRNLDGGQTMGIKNSNINNASSSSRNPDKGTEGKSHDQSCILGCILYPD